MLNKFSNRQPLNQKLKLKYMIEPLQVIEESDSEISIVWSDDAETKYNAAELRRNCPCAGCVNEWTGEKILRDESVSDDLSFYAHFDCRQIRAQFSFFRRSRHGNFYLQISARNGGKLNRYSAECAINKSANRIITALAIARYTDFFRLVIIKLQFYFAGRAILCRKEIFSMNGRK